MRLLPLSLNEYGNQGLAKSIDKWDAEKFHAFAVAIKAVDTTRL